MTDSLLTTEGMDGLIGKGLYQILDYDTEFDVESGMIAVAAALGLIPSGCRDWKHVIYCSLHLSNLLCEMFYLFVDKGIIIRCGDDSFKLPSPESRMIVPDGNSAKFVDASHPDAKIAIEL